MEKLLCLGLLFTVLFVIVKNYLETTPIGEHLNNPQNIVWLLKNHVYRICNNMGNFPTVPKQTTTKKGDKLLLEWKNTRWKNTNILAFSYVS